jgi:hypothetical protein
MYILLYLVRTELFFYSCIMDFFFSLRVSLLFRKGILKSSVSNINYVDIFGLLKKKLRAMLFNGRSVLFGSAIQKFPSDSNLMKSTCYLPVHAQEA